TRSLLLMMKLKAAWDRNWRIENDKSRNPSWERGKLEKDHSDILALIDPARGRQELDLSFLGNELNSRPFLREVFERTKTSFDSAQKYQISIQQTHEMVAGLERMLF
ncbi:MAG: hypothetical protein KAT70_09990, partial [Thermoplasmata archaeon]|nr:hypothetical protein [Thermoplasmata archaeon]